jgi:hypothetical protein
MSKTNVTFSGDWPYTEAARVIRGLKGCKPIHAHKGTVSFVFRPVGGFWLDVVVRMDLDKAIAEAKERFAVQEKPARHHASKEKRRARRIARASQKRNMGNKVARNNNRRRLDRAARGK